MTTTFTDFMPAKTHPTTEAIRVEANTGEEVKDMSLFELAPRRQTRADLDRLVVLERLKQRRRVSQHLRSVHSQLWGVRANR